MAKRWFWLVGIGLVGGCLSLGATVRAAEWSASERSEPEAEPVTQVIIQIGGRFCEYHREDVENALRRYGAVHSVEFLNNHGTVLIRYHREVVPSVEFAESVERALAMGIGCKVWVDRGSPQSPKS